MSAEVVDVFVGNYTDIDWDLFELWVNGYEVSEALSFIAKGFKKDKKNLSNASLSDYPSHYITTELLASELNNNFKMFTMMEQLLVTHGKFTEQFQFNSDIQTLWIERYYSLNDSVCRELLGKKLSSRVRKDLDEIAEKTGFSLKSCRRQFDNIKRILKYVEDSPTANFVAYIQDQFGLSTKLSEYYATLVLFGNFRFEIAKRKLLVYPFEVLKQVSLNLMQFWLEPDDPNCSSYEPSFDREFLSSLRDLKALSERDKEHRNVVLAHLQKHVQHQNPESQTSNKDREMSPKTYSEIEHNFKHLSRGILVTGQSLYKDVRDFFVVLVEKIIEPLKQTGANKEEARLFLKYYKVAVTDNFLLIDMDVKLTFKKYMTALTPCILALYP